MVIKRVVVFGVVWLVSAVVTVGVLTVAAGVSEADTPPPDPPWVRGDSIWPVAGPEGRQIGWVYHPPIDLSSPPPSELPADPEHSRRIFDDQGGETLVIEDGPEDRHHVGPIFSTREEAERYRDSLLDGSGGAPVNVND